MLQYIKISNDIINELKVKGASGLGELGLFAIIQTYLSIPNFETPIGGLRNAISQHCEDSSYLIKKYTNMLMNDGYLKKGRLSVNTNKFKDYYLLFLKADKSIPFIQYIKRGVSEDYLKNNYNHMVGEYKKYMPISRNIIMDANLSLAEKGLYIVFAKALSVRDNITMINYLPTREEIKQYYITKEYIRSLCGGQYHAFNTLWRNLKYKGYLRAEPYYCGVCHMNTNWYYLAEYEAKIDKPTQVDYDKDNKRGGRRSFCDDKTPQVELSKKGLTKFFNEMILKRLSKPFKGDKLASDAVQVMIDTILNKKGIRLKKKTVSFRKVAENFLKMNVVYFENALRLYRTRSSHRHPLTTLKALFYYSEFGEDSYYIRKLLFEENYSSI